MTLFFYYFLLTFARIYVLILPNVRIGSNVIVGAGSVVSKDISDNSVAAGIPCRVVGNFDDLVKKYAKRKNDNRTMLG